MKILIEDFNTLENHYRANLINSVIGVKQASLIGTVGVNCISNLALFSSTVHLGSNPPLVAIFSRPEGDTPKQTLKNIIDNRDYSINHVNKSIINRAHSCSFKFSAEESEFTECNLSEKFITDFKAPFVKESNVSFAVRYQRHLSVQENGVIMVIGKIKSVFVNENIIQDNGEVDFNYSSSVGVAGNNTYYGLDKIKSLKYLKSDQKNQLKKIVDKESYQNSNEAK
tara:strand:- start:3859 stop:4536 length:678 start_codon:yes stop_codon:yes gene_type:complete